MKKRTYRGLVIFAGLLLLSAIWIFRPYSSYDPEAVSKKLSDLEEPFQSVETAYFLDGGSIGVHIIDAQGREGTFCLRASSIKREEKYQRLYAGSLHYTTDSSVEVAEPKDTIIRLLEVLRSAEGVERSRDIAIASASGRWSDMARLLRRRFISREYPADESY